MVNQTKELSKILEALLFFKGEPVSIAWLKETLKKKEDEIREAITLLKEELLGRGLALVEAHNTWTLTTSTEVSSEIERIAKIELERDLGKAALETLTIVLYRGSLTKGEIDYIRGVNSNFILRALLIRGLVEREKNPKDERGFLYMPSVELLSFMGISSVTELPEYQSVREEIIKFEKSFDPTQDQPFDTAQGKQNDERT